MAEFGQRVDTVAVDFDGVCHLYGNGWQDGSIYDEAVENTVPAMRYLMKHYAVFIFTSRHPPQVVEWVNGKLGLGSDVAFCEPDENFYRGKTGNECATEGLLFPCFHEDQHRQFWNEQGRLLVTRRKLSAVWYVDDRALRFRDWEHALEVIQTWPVGMQPYASTTAPKLADG